MSSTLDSAPKSKMASGDVGKLKVGQHEIDLPIVVGTEDEAAVDIGKLRSQTGFITLDEGYGNTGACTSAITYLDGEKGVLRYRGYPIEVLAEHSDFVEVSYLLIYGELPTDEEWQRFRSSLLRHTMLHEDMRSFYNGLPRDAHPMATLSSVVGALSTFYQDSLDPRDRAAGGNLGPPPDGQAADDRGVQLQEIDRPAVYLSAERSFVSGKLSAHDVRRAVRTL